MTGLVSEMTTDAMTTTDCWAVLREQELGRLVYRCGEEMHITPVNYAVDGHRVVFRTAEGEKLAALRDYPDVVFEVDESFDDAATSVIVRGRASELHGEEALMVDQLRLRPWVPQPAKHHVIAIEVASITGRSFSLAKPWLHIVNK